MEIWNILYNKFVGYHRFFFDFVEFSVRLVDKMNHPEDYIEIDDHNDDHIDDNNDDDHNSDIDDHSNNLTALIPF